MGGSRRKEKEKRKRRRKRGKKKGRRSVDSLLLLHSNPRGWLSKKTAILDVIKTTSPDYVNLNETQLRGDNKVSIKDYTCYSKNRKDVAGGGICSAVSSRLQQHTVCVGEGGEGDEWLMVRSQVSGVTCHVSRVRYHVSHVTCNSQTIRAK